tara:strand:+ start:485 stop:709 length:225 start_codon:yes stop_codon:yes gene_type:complete
VIDIKRGDLVYIPADVVLYNPPGQGFSYLKLDRPVNALVLADDDPKKVKVLLDGARWEVYRTKVYAIEEALRRT